MVSGAGIGWNEAKVDVRSLNMHSYWFLSDLGVAWRRSVTDLLFYALRCFEYLFDKHFFTIDR